MSQVKARTCPIVFVASVAAAFLSCDSHHAVHASYQPLEEVEATYGELMTAGNHPTADQNGTGERVGLFRDENGTIWGLPVTVDEGGRILGCAPPALRDQKVTDTFPPGSTVIGSTNEPTGWRGGTGKLEIVVRDVNGTVHWKAVRGGQVDGGPPCWAPHPPGLPRELHYYRLQEARAISDARTP
jgi:hypothetical protein